MTEHLALASLQTKVTVPVVPSALILRKRLWARLNEGLQRDNCRLMLVSAPAGFGKTTLLSSWAVQTEAQVAWLTLDDEDNDLARFLANVYAACRRALPEISTSIPDQLHAPRKIVAMQSLTALLNDIVTLFSGRKDERLILILDDYHLITTPEIHDALSFLIERSPPRMHIVIATRADPPLPVARLRGRGQLVEIRQADLTFTEEEAESFLSKAMCLQLPDTDVRTLTRRTEGWIAGLQMAALALRSEQRQHRDLHRLAESFGGRHRYVLDYLSDEVLRYQPAPVLDFLLETAVLERLCASLCDAVTARNDGQAMLAKLDEDNLFVVPLDNERRWYRYHRLFADLLRARLREQHPDRIETLHSRAAAWYESQGDIAATIHHLMAAGALSQAAGKVEYAAPSILRRSEVSRFLRWVNQLPDEIVSARPMLTLYAAWALLLSGAPLHEAAKRLSPLELDSEPWASRASLLPAFDSLFHGQFARAESVARRVLICLPEDDSFWREMASWIISMAVSYPADTGAVEDRLLHVAHLAQNSGDVLVAVSALCGLAGLRQQQGLLDQASRFYEQALTLARDEEGDLLPVAGQALIGKGSVALERNELERAQKNLEHGIELISRWRNIAALRGLVSLSWVRHLQGDEDTAYRLLDRAEQLAASFDAVEWDDHFVSLSRARLQLACDDLPAVRRWVERRGVTAPYRVDNQDMDDRLRKYEHLVLARLLLAENRPREAVHYLDPVLQFAQRKQRTRMIIEIQTLRAMALQSSGEENAALLALEQALQLATPGNYLRIFLDEREGLVRLLYWAVQRKKLPDHAQKLVATLQEGALWPSARQPADGGQRLLEPLSERELEVLSLVARGLTNLEIAEHLVISVTTVKWHTSNIYGKLGVTNRVQAVARAQALGVLPAVT